MSLVKEVRYDYFSVHYGFPQLNVLHGQGFGYHFDALVNESNELASAFSELFKAVSRFNVLEFLQLWFPILSIIVRTESLITTLHV